MHIRQHGSRLFPLINLRCRLPRMPVPSAELDVTRDEVAGDCVDAALQDLGAACVVGKDKVVRGERGKVRSDVVGDVEWFGHVAGDAVEW